MHSALCHCPLLWEWGWSSDNQSSQHALLRYSWLIKTLPGSYATDWWNRQIEWMKSVSMGSFQYKNQVNWESFVYLWVILLYSSQESRLIPAVFELGQVRLFWKLTRSIIWKLSHSCQTGVWEYFPSSLALKWWNTKMECWFKAKMIYSVVTMWLILHYDFSNWQFSNTWLLVMWLNRVSC